MVCEGGMGVKHQSHPNLVELVPNWARLALKALSKLGRAERREPRPHSSDFGVHVSRLLAALHKSAVEARRISAAVQPYA